MHTTVKIPITDLLLDTSNARLGDEQPSQQAAYLTLAKQQGRRLIKLAQDIVEFGTDPTTIVAVVATNDRRPRYRVLEGNRRVLALKALETPTTVSAAFSKADQRKLLELSAAYAADPLDEIDCVLFDSEDDVFHWIDLRHTGANDGAGLVEWDSNEQDRFRHRHGKNQSRNPAGQVIDFIDNLDGAPTSKTRIVTTLKRIIVALPVREKLGLEIQAGVVLSHYPRDEVAKGLRKIVSDLRSQTIKVKDVYEAADREEYLKKFTESDLPDASTKLKTPVPLMDLPASVPFPSGEGAGSDVGGEDAEEDEENPPPPPPRRKPTKKRAPRTSVAPNDCGINPEPPRMNSIFNELQTMDADSLPNSSAVLLRVFLELSVDHEIERSKLMSENERLNSPLSKRMKMVAAKMLADGRIVSQLEKAIVKVADSQHTIAASNITFNQYVHNKYVLPKPSEIRTAWDELQPFLEELWR